MQPLLNIGMRAARRAGDLIVRSLSRLDSIKIDTKGRNDFVTDIDRKAEADIIATIRRSHEYFAHYHTGGVPGRHEIDDTQELNYAAIMRAVVATGYTGHVSQEFIPARPEPLVSLKQAVGICDV